MKKYILSIVILLFIIITFVYVYATGPSRVVGDGIHDFLSGGVVSAGDKLLLEGTSDCLLLEGTADCLLLEGT